MEGAETVLNEHTLLEDNVQSTLNRKAPSVSYVMSGTPVFSLGV